jgi:hypothetical protein
VLAITAILVADLIESADQARSLRVNKALIHGRAIFVHRLASYFVRGLLNSRGRYRLDDIQALVTEDDTMTCFRSQLLSYFQRLPDVLQIQEDHGASLVH